MMNVFDFTILILVASMMEFNIVFEGITVDSLMKYFILGVNLEKVFGLDRFS